MEEKLHILVLCPVRDLNSTGWVVPWMSMPAAISTFMYNGPELHWNFSEQYLLLWQKVLPLLTSLEAFLGLLTGDRAKNFRFFRITSRTDH